MLRKTAAVAMVAVALTGCVSHTWAPGPGATLPFGQASGQCKLAALGSQEGFIAVGNANYVAGAALGNAIGNAVRTNVTYNACMEAQGFVAVDGQPQPAVQIAAAAPTAPSVTQAQSSPIGLSGQWTSTAFPGGGGQLRFTDVVLRPDGTMAGRIFFTGSRCGTEANFSGRFSGSSAQLAMNTGCGLTEATLRRGDTGWTGTYRSEEIQDTGTLTTH